MSLVSAAHPPPPQPPIQIGRGGGAAAASCCRPLGEQSCTASLRTPDQLLHWESNKKRSHALDHVHDQSQRRGTERDQEDDGRCTGARRDEVGRDVQLFFFLLFFGLVRTCHLMSAQRGFLNRSWFAQEIFTSAQVVFSSGDTPRSGNRCVSLIVMAWVVGREKLDGHELPACDGARRRAPKP